MSRSTVSRKTLSRRAALRASAAAAGGVAALSLIGCGDDDSGSSGGSKEAVTDSTKGIPGGTLRRYIAGYREPTVVDNSRAYDMAGWALSSLMNHTWGVDSVSLDDYFTLEPDLAVSMPEQAPDQVTYTFKLHSGVKFHNGRTLTSEDVAYSFNRYATSTTSATKSIWDVWFDRVQTPDPLTVVIKAKMPFADALIAMGGSKDAYILAKEWEESPNQANEKVIGTGPFIMESVTSPITVTMRKNPEYFRKPYPYFDKVEHYATTDVPKRIADFTARQVHIPWLVYADERDQIKQQRPDAVIQTYDTWGPGLAMRTDQAPFNDKRVRQALSMSVDRNKISVGVTKGEGRPDQWLSLMYKDVLGAREVKDLGPAAKYWDYNVAEAKKLLSAAGINSPIQGTNSHWNGAVVGQWFVDLWVLAESMWKEAGIADITDNPQIAAQHSQTTGRGIYEGMSGSVSGGSNTGAPAFTIGIRDKWYQEPGTPFSPSNQSKVNDAQLGALAQKQVGQLNLQDRLQTYRQMEPIIAEEQYYVMFNTTTQSWAWDPSIRNIRIPKEQANHTTSAMKWWFG